MVTTKKINRSKAIIAITGRKGHGKDTLAKIIARCPPPAGKSWKGEWLITHFADPLKQMTKAVFGLTDRDLYTAEGKEAPLPKPIELDMYLRGMRQITGADVRPRGMIAHTPRQVLQFFGTEYVRAVSPSYWFDQLALNIRGHQKVLIPDLRFQNEAKFVRSLEGVVVRVTRIDLSSSDDAHASEAEIDGIEPDLELGTVTDRFALQERVARLINAGKFHSTAPFDYRKWEPARDAYLAGASIEKASIMLSGSKHYATFQNLLVYYGIPFRNGKPSKTKIPHKTIRGKANKLCTACDRWKPLTAFNRSARSWDQLGPRCRPCASAYNKAHYQSHGANKTLESMHARGVADARRRSIPWNLSIENLRAQWDAQGGRCQYSGVLLTNRPGPTCMSLDRVDSGKGYVTGNVVFCTRVANLMKRDLTVEEFFATVQQLYTHMKKSR